MLAREKPDISILSDTGKGLFDYIKDLQNQQMILDILYEVSQSILTLTM